MVCYATAFQLLEMQLLRKIGKLGHSFQTCMAWRLFSHERLLSNPIKLSLPCLRLPLCEIAEDAQGLSLFGFLREQLAIVWYS